MFTVIWKYKVKKMFKMDFEKLYGGNGKWVKLFERGEGYIGTKLIRDVFDNWQYVTIDTWVSQNLYEKFLSENKREFAVIDAEGENLTESETKIGWFEDREIHKVN